ncbi:histone-lysine N-methyltransferase SUV39H2-like [Actinia tenebrosa]|uniref:Histone-lysine N-methyltransferase SUV39H2-like n=1 Tax=Actinia tenebrosa TaxID=6105 RepID=A0A6P8I3J8_ACTTE|nr:histone-lysine N-methyltransferase SUV39H2-like [Actinia tenebrosa]
MEEQGAQLIQKGIEYLNGSKYGSLDVDLLDAMLPKTENISTEQQPQQFECNNEIETTNIHIQRPAPPTPPLEEDFKPIKEEIFTASREEKTGRRTKRQKKLKRKDAKMALARQLGMEDCSVPCLLSVKELRGKFETRYKLYLDVNTKKNSNSSSYLSAYKRKWDLLLKLEAWEKLLNKCSPNEPYISVENKVDNSGPPEEFVYIASSKMPSNLDYLFDKDYLVGCSCERCTPLTCDCPKNSGGSFAYDRFGRVQFEPGKPIYECNSRCSCSISCRNRVVQRGRTVRVTIFRTTNGCGWGVKTMDPILKNQFVTEYVGEVLTNEEAEERGKIYDHVGQTYLFDLDYNEGECAYTIDAKKYGNISHFINHSCDPNLSVYGVWVETLDPRMPKIAFFASRDIQSGEELTFDYLMTAGESSSPVRSSAKKTKRIPCQCGAKNCRNYLF